MNVWLHPMVESIILLNVVRGFVCLVYSLLGFLSPLYNFVLPLFYFSLFVANYKIKLISSNYSSNLEVLESLKSFKLRNCSPY